MERAVGPLENITLAVQERCRDISMERSALSAAGFDLRELLGAHPDADGPG
jgi:hypothetical protein